MTISSNQIRPYLSDRPVEGEKDFLWVDQHKGVRDELQRIANHIVGSLLPETITTAHKLSKSMTFAVFGKWGIGKSSALGMIAEEIRELTRDKFDQVIICEYDAPRYEAASDHYNALYTLTYKIIQELVSGVDHEKLIQLIHEAEFIFDLESLVPKKPEEKDPKKAGTRPLVIQQRITEAFSELIDLNKPLATFLKDMEHVLVVMIDDLDRCQKPFIWQVLNAIQRLSAIENLFFVLAVDQDRLQEAIKEQAQTIEGLRDPSYTLEKYIQQYVTLPNMDAGLLKAYIGKLKQDTPDSLALQLIEESENVNLLFNGLHELTPRSVKRFLNARDRQLGDRMHILGEVQKLELYTSEEMLKKRSKVLKEILLEYSWPHFYQEHLAPLLKIEASVQEGNKESDAFEALKALEREYWEYSSLRDSELLRFKLQRLAAQYRKPEWESLDDKLARLLGTRPFWFFPEEKSQEKRLTGEERLKKPPKALPSDAINREEKPQKEETPEVADQEEEVMEQIDREIQRLTQEGASPGEVEVDPEVQFKRLYIHSQAPEAQKDPRVSLLLAWQIFKLISGHRGSFDARQASQVGNVAVDAERFEARELADNLYRLALELNPEHSNNIQNYVDFIINVRLQDHYEEAEQLLKKLRTGSHALHRPERTLLLEIRLATLTRKTEQMEVVKQELVAFVDTFLNDPSSRQQFSTLMSLLKRFGDFKSAREVAKAYYDHATDEAIRYASLRGLADMLAASSEGNDEKEAMDIYRFMLDHISCEEEQRDLPDIQHNYAILLYKYDYDNTAGRLWFDAYKSKMSDRNIQRSYSDYLLRAGRAGLAEMVIDGKPVEEMVLVPEQKKLPEQFSDKVVSLWWEQARPAEAVQA